MSDKKDKKGDGAAGKAMSVSAHPRARASIRRTRARTALFAFAIVLFLSMRSGVTGQEAALRAVVAGMVGNLVGWACALAVWRQIVVQEVRTVVERRQERARAHAEAARAAAEAAAAS